MWPEKPLPAGNGKRVLLKVGTGRFGNLALLAGCSPMQPRVFSNPSESCSVAVIQGCSSLSSSLLFYSTLPSPSPSYHSRNLSTCAQPLFPTGPSPLSSPMSADCKYTHQAFSNGTRQQILAAETWRIGSCQYETTGEYRREDASGCAEARQDTLDGF